MKAAVMMLVLGGWMEAAAADWIYLSSANFELYTSAGEREARQTLETFEQVRDFFMRVKSTNVTTQLPVTIVAFRNAREFKPYAINEFATAYYTGDEQRDYIVMTDPGLEHTPVAIHEYMHLLVRHSRLKIPVWLNEGFAEVHSTLKPSGNQILLGSVPRGRTVALAQRKWLSIRQLDAVGHGSAEYTEKERAGIFYAESWLLTHMLMLSEEYREGFSRFFAQMAKSSSAEEAFPAVYGKTLEQVEKDLDRYYRSSSLQAVLFKTRFEKIDVGRPRPAGELETGLALARLLLLSGHKEEAARRLDELAASHKDGFEVEEALAYVEWRKGNRDAALAHFDLAVARGAAGWKILWDYARLLPAGQPGSNKRIGLLQKVVALRPDFTDARFLLGQEYFRDSQYDAALATLSAIKAIDIERTGPMYLALAYSAMHTGRDAEARRFAEQARHYAGDDSQNASAQRVLDYLAQKGRAGSPPARPAPAPASPDDGPAGERAPTLKRRAAQPEEASLSGRAGNRRTVTGRLVRLDCLGSVARLHLVAGSATHLLLIRDPGRVAISGGQGGAVELPCGPQDKGAEVDFVPATDAGHRTSGDVVAIRFVD